MLRGVCNLYFKTTLLVWYTRFATKGCKPNLNWYSVFVCMKFIKFQHLAFSSLTMVCSRLFSGQEFSRITDQILGWILERICTWSHNNTVFDFQFYILLYFDFIPVRSHGLAFVIVLTWSSGIKLYNLK